MKKYSFKNVYELKSCFFFLDPLLPKEFCDLFNKKPEIPMENITPLSKHLVERTVL